MSEPIVLTGTATFAFNPIAYPGAWRFGVDEWVAEFQVAARSSYGLGALSDVVEVTIEQETSYFVGLTYSEVRDSATAAGVTGKQKMIVPAFTPRGLELRRYSCSPLHVEQFRGDPQRCKRPDHRTRRHMDLDHRPRLGNHRSRHPARRDSARDAWYPASQAKQFT